jgi:hypothetical protein
MGLKSDPSGMMIFKGLRHPALRGMSSSTRVRKTYSTAALPTAAGALKLLGRWGEVPVKSMVALRWAASISMRHLNLAAVIEGIGELARGKPLNHPPHTVLRIVLHMAHVGLHGVEPLVRH